MTQAQLHAASSVSISTLSRMENSERGIGKQTVLKVAVALGVPITEIYTDDPTPEPEWITDLRATMHDLRDRVQHIEAMCEEDRKRHDRSA